jgi:hypothetical protein
VQVKVPKTYPDFTTRRVLTQEWLYGEKLSQSQAADTGDLVKVSAHTHCASITLTRLRKKPIPFAAQRGVFRHSPPTQGSSSSMMFVMVVLFRWE